MLLRDEDSESSEFGWTVTINVNFNSLLQQTSEQGLSPQSRKITAASEVIWHLCKFLFKITIRHFTVGRGVALSLKIQLNPCLYTKRGLNIKGCSKLHVENGKKNSIHSSLTTDIHPYFEKYISFWQLQIYIFWKSKKTNFNIL